ncbi:MAG: 1-aminocyclopropane-1-carboxylate deaminase/D-cysteine desulfhydrase [Bacteroidetes bacterium]|nr:1-aminocyclopropane-1-carboxylate deaminase/D-cysteine desulfhydrase [Bacteroidota bacterium]
MSPSVQNLQLQIFWEKGIQVDVLRLDQIHPIVSGNKWYKLKYYLKEAVDKNYRSILTFGGAYSNHIVATACAAKEAGLQSIGIIRGEKPHQLSSTLSDAIALGMHLEFISREDYKSKSDPVFLKGLAEKYPNALIVPEGGAGQLGVMGSKEMLDGIDHAQYTHILCAIGTGTSFEGLSQAVGSNSQMIGIVVLKGMREVYTGSPQKQIIHAYHFGGYAKKNDALLAFMNHFFTQTKIPSDFVYTGKLFYAMMDMVEKDVFAVGSRLLVVHSGGLQGNRSLPAGTLVF